MNKTQFLKNKRLNIRKIAPHDFRTILHDLHNSVQKHVLCRKRRKKTVLYEILNGVFCLFISVLCVCMWQFARKFNF